MRPALVPPAGCKRPAPCSEQQQSPAPLAQASRLARQAHRCGGGSGVGDRHPRWRRRAQKGEGSRRARRRRRAPQLGDDLLEGGALARLLRPAAPQQRHIRVQRHPLLRAAAHVGKVNGLSQILTNTAAGRAGRPAARQQGRSAGPAGAVPRPAVPTQRAGSGGASSGDWRTRTRERCSCAAHSQGICILSGRRARAGRQPPPASRGRAAGRAAGCRAALRR